MTRIKRRATYLAVILFFSTLVHADEPLPNRLTKLNSPSGMELLKENLNLNALKMLSNFTTQKTNSYCGIASAVMILNSININPPLDSHHLPYHYFTQEDFFNDTVKKVISPEEVQLIGINLIQLAKTLQCYDLIAKPYFANELNLEQFRSLLKTALANQNYIIANYLRTELDQIGRGHHSPVVAYDAASDAFLILDVARFKYPPYWVKTEDLWRAVDTKDEDSYRGVIIISPSISKETAYSP